LKILEKVLMLLVAISFLNMLGKALADEFDVDQIRELVDEMVVEHDFESGELLALFDEAEKKERIIELISRPAEKAKPWHEYREIFVTNKRINAGVEFWEKNRESLEKARQIYGVEPHFIVSIIGVETFYGRITGGYRVLDSLATLSFGYPPRSKFFRRELKQFLLLSREEGKDPLALSGSYAGAMGFGQFIPSSYREYAVDFDGDGYRDIWSNKTDAIGSVGNYFERHGWNGKQVVVVPVRLSGDTSRIKPNIDWKPEKTVRELAKDGLDLGSVKKAISLDTKATLIKMDGKSGPEYWLGTNDFYVITRYNHSRMYALAVFQLADAILDSMKKAKAS